MKPVQEVSRMIGFIVAVLLNAGTAAVAGPDDAFPDKPVRLILPVPPGGSVDSIARMLANKLQVRWGQPVVVDNRPGASGNIGIGMVERAVPNGYTLMFGAGAPLAINKTIFPDQTVDPERLIPVSRVATNPIVMIVNPKVPAASLEAFISYAKANPEKLNYASGGTGGIPQLAAEMFKLRTGVKMTEVAYKGIAPAVIALLSGEADVFFVDISTAIEHIRSGSVRVLGVAAQTRSPVFPDIPAMTELMPGFTAETWFALAAPPATPPALVNKVSAAVSEIIHQPESIARLKAMGNIEAIGSTPEEMGRFLQTERSRWGEVVRTLGLAKK